MKSPVSQQLMLFPEASHNHANLFPLPGSEKAGRMTVTSGRKWLELLKNSNPLSSLVKMFLESSRWVSTKRLLTWKVSVTPQQRLVFRLVPSMPRIPDSEYGLWLTPRSSDGEGGVMKMKENMTGRYKLRDQVQSMNKQFWPTPAASDNRDRGHIGMPSIQRRIMEKKQLGLSMTVSNQSGSLNPTWVEWLMGFPQGWTDLNVSETP